MSGTNQAHGRRRASWRSLSVPKTIQMSSMPLPRSSPARAPLQQVRGRGLATACLRFTSRRSMRTGVWTMIWASLLLSLAKLPPVATEPNAFGEARTSVDRILPAIAENATCAEWAAWIPQRSEPAVVMQVVSTGYIPIQQNFIRLMERNSAFNRHNLYLMCLDDASKRFFEEQMGIVCVPVSWLHPSTHRDIWKLRVHVMSCLVRVGHVDVIMSDADALWIKDPTPELFHSQSKNSESDGDGSSQGSDQSGRIISTVDTFGGGSGGAARRQQSSKKKSRADIRDSDVVASRGSFPGLLGQKWGTTICMGFVLFRARNVAGMATFLRVMEDFVMNTGDDQASVNKAAADLGITWEKSSDMRYTESTRYGVGEIPADSIAAAAAGHGANFSGGVGSAFEDGHQEGHPLMVTLLPHSTYTRICDETPVSDRTVVAHCLAAKIAALLAMVFVTVAGLNRGTSSSKARGVFHVKRNSSHADVSGTSEGDLPPLAVSFAGSGAVVLVARGLWKEGISVVLSTDSSRSEVKSKRRRRQPCDPVGRLNSCDGD